MEANIRDILEMLGFRTILCCLSIHISCISENIPSAENVLLGIKLFLMDQFQIESERSGKGLHL